MARLVIFLVFASSILYLSLFAQPGRLLAGSTIINLPFIASPEAACSSHVETQAMINLIKFHPEQQRNRLKCNSILMDVAQARATDLATRNYFDHTTPEGIGPNYLVIEAGYPLSWHYARDRAANSIESIMAGTAASRASEALPYMLNSSLHRDHILGRTPLFVEQREIGIGYAANPSSTYRHYWVVIIAAPEE